VNLGKEVGKFKKPMDLLKDDATTFSVLSLYNAKAR